MLIKEFIDLLSINRLAKNHNNLVIMLKIQFSKNMAIVDTRCRATAPLFFVYLTKKKFWLGEMKILLESPSSNMRELEISN